MSGLRALEKIRDRIVKGGLFVHVDVDMPESARRIIASERQELILLIDQCILDLKKDSMLINRQELVDTIKQEARQKEVQKRVSEVNKLISDFKIELHTTVDDEFKKEKPHRFFSFMYPFQFVKNTEEKEKEKETPMKLVQAVEHMAKGGKVRPENMPSHLEYLHIFNGFIYTRAKNGEDIKTPKDFLLRSENFYIYEGDKKQKGDEAKEPTHIEIVEYMNGSGFIYKREKSYFDNSTYARNPNTKIIKTYKKQIQQWKK